MRSKLKERFERLGPVRGVDRAHSGSSVDLALRSQGKPTNIKSVDAALVLAACGVSLLRAKRLIEAVVEAGEAFVHLPIVGSVEAVAEELRRAGISPARLGHGSVDVKAMRSKFGFTQEQFALRFGLDVDAVRNWEQGRCLPDKSSAAYLRAIAADPDTVAKAQEAAI